MERFGTIAIAGVGLIGGSIGLAIRRKELADRVIGLGRDRDRLEVARSLGAIDEGTTDPARAAAEAAILVVCTPTNRIAADVCRLAEICRPDALITDAGSAKRRIVEAVEADVRARRVFVAAHPLSGSERRGATAAKANLLDGRVCVLTPTKQTPADRLALADRFWSALGCRTVRLNPDEHDAALAFTSHLPHIAAAALALSVPAEALPLAAGAYRDGTRVAAADPDLWVAIFRENPEHLHRAIDEFRTHLDRFQAALAADDPVALRGLWEQARTLRNRFDARPSD